MNHLLTKKGKEDMFYISWSAGCLYCFKYFIAKPVILSDHELGYTGLQLATDSLASHYQTAQFTNSLHRSAANWEQWGVGSGEIWMCRHKQPWCALLWSRQSLRTR